MMFENAQDAATTKSAAFELTDRLVLTPNTANISEAWVVLKARRCVLVCHPVDLYNLACKYRMDFNIRSLYITKLAFASQYGRDFKAVDFPSF